MHALGPGSEIDGFRLGELIHVGSMASIYRLTGPAGPLPLIIKIPRLGPGERAVNVVAFEVCRMVLGANDPVPGHGVCRRRQAERLDRSCAHCA